jgi:hypothetical protein
MCQHALLNSQKGLSKVGFIRKLMIWHGWQSSSILSIPSQKVVLIKSVTFKIESDKSSRG